MRYLDFDLELREHDGLRYQIVARAAVGESSTIVAFPLTDAELETQLLRLENAILRSTGRRRMPQTPEERLLQSFGQQLFDFLLHGDVRTLYYEALQAAGHQQWGVRLRLHIQPPTLALLPWEFLYDPRRGDYLCLDPYTPLVRYPDLPQRIQPLPVNSPLRILGVVASPSDLAHLDVATEKANLERALQGLRERGLVELTWLPSATWRDLQRAMRTSAGPWHILHFIGHGGFDATRGEGVLYLVDEAGRSRAMGATQLSRLLAGQRYSLRLAVLNACEGARGGREDILSSTAATLVQGGLPAVLAMQYDITDLAAVELAQSFYEGLADGLPVDTAVAYARNAVSLANERSLEWGTPVLYMRAPDGQLFAVAEGAQPSLSSPSGSTKAEVSPPRDIAVSTAPPTAVQAEPEQPQLRQILTELRQILAMLYDNETDVRRVVADAGIDETRIAFSGHATNNWQAVLREAEKRDQVSGLVQLALKEYGNNTALQSVAAAYQRTTGHSAPRGGSPAMASPALSATSMPADRAASTKATIPKNDPLAIDFAWVKIPAGDFNMGEDKTQHTVYLPEYRIAKVPVTNAQYKRFVDANAYQPPDHWQNGEIPAGKEDHPVVRVSWRDALAFCMWAGVRLPSEAEWEKAAAWDAQKGVRRNYPWGDEFYATLCNSVEAGIKDTTPVGKYPTGASAYGVLDMAGNVWEWMGSLYKSYPYKSDDSREDPAANGRRVVRGGSFDGSHKLVRCAYRSLDSPVGRDVNLGFRVASSGT